MHHFVFIDALISVVETVHQTNVRFSHDKVLKFGPYSLKTRWWTLSKNHLYYFTYVLARVHFHV